MPRALAAAATLAAAGLAGCGSAVPARPVSGAAVFARECSLCHSLIGNESRHRPGGDLLGYTLTRRELLLQTRQMPVRESLSGAQLTAVVDYVAEMEQRARGR